MTDISAIDENKLEDILSDKAVRKQDQAGAGRNHRGQPDLAKGRQRLYYSLNQSGKIATGRAEC